MQSFTILVAPDAASPEVASACATDFVVQGDGQFSLVTTRIDVLFNEAVEKTTAENVANYSLTDPVNGVNLINSATRDPANCNLVHLTLGLPINNHASSFDVTVTNVKDLAGNTIVSNGTTNVGSFFIQNVTFEGNMSLQLCSGSFAPSDDFSVEGNLLPLTFDPLCDNAKMYDPDVDSVYATTVPFCYPKDPITGKGEATLEWKLVHACTDFEPLGSNRMALLSSDNGATDVLSVVWNDEVPEDFTSQAIDVIFQIDANPFSPGPDTVVTLHGDQSPLSFSLAQGISMVDDGSGEDVTALDGIYTATVRFNQCSFKNVQWKVAYNGEFECFEQGNREVFLNDAVADTIGGAKGPITLPAREIDRCTTSDNAIDVIFQVDVTALQNVLGPGDSVAVRGDVLPLTFEGTPDPSAVMVDDGSGDDAVPGDNIFTARVTFPDSSNLHVEYKYRAAGMFECLGFGNRSFKLDDLNHSTANPQIRPINLWDYCEDNIVAVPGPADLGAGRIQLYQNAPNPFREKTTIRFEISQRGPVHLSIYNVAGRRIATLVNGSLDAGPHQVSWNRLDAGGIRVPSGVYFYELRLADQRSNRVMVIVQ
jgi:hypothetical protein